MLPSGVRFGSNRALTPSALLKTVRSDPGMTVHYYANRYFGRENLMPLTHMMWAQLKRHGKVMLDRSDGRDQPPRWYPSLEMPRRHEVHRHNPNEEDLSFLHTAEGDDTGPVNAPMAPPAPPAPSLASATLTSAPPATAAAAAVADGSADPLRVESLVLHLVQNDAGRDIQHYIGLLPPEMRAAAPVSFRTLREGGLLARETTAHGTFVWQPVH